MRHGNVYCIPFMTSTTTCNGAGCAYRAAWSTVLPLYATFALLIRYYVYYVPWCRPLADHSPYSTATRSIVLSTMVNAKMRHILLLESRVERYVYI